MRKYAKRIAQGTAPYESGNLRHNAIHVRKKGKFSFQTIYDGNAAYYTPYVNEGWTHHISGRWIPGQWFVQNAASQIDMMMKEMMAGKMSPKIKSNLNKYKGKIKETKPTNPLRQYRLNKSLNMRLGGVDLWKSRGR